VILIWTSSFKFPYFPSNVIGKYQSAVIIARKSIVVDLIYLGICISDLFCVIFSVWSKLLVIGVTLPLSGCVADSSYQ